MEKRTRWLTVPGHPDYEVSDQGDLRRVVAKRGSSVGRVLRGSVIPSGHVRVTVDGRGELLHRLVALAFLGEPGQDQEARHLNGNPADNRAVNLAWGTRSENQADAVRHRAHGNTRKTHCPQGHEYTEANTYTRATATGVNRQCRACARARAAVYRRHADG